MQSVVANARKVCGHYILLEKLGMGGQGEVWRVQDEREGCELALKIRLRRSRATKARGSRSSASTRS